MLRRAVLALACVTTCLVSYCPAQDQTVELIRIVPLESTLDGTFVGSDVTVVVTGRTTEGAIELSPCGTIGGEFPAYTAVIVRRDLLSDPGARVVVVASKADLSPGTRLQNATSDTKQCCNTVEGATTSCLGPDARFAVWLTTIEPVKPANSAPLLFYSPEDLTGESLGVVTGPQDEEGFADVVLTKQGQPPMFSTILADTALKPADRIVDIVLLDDDPETGIGLYGAFVEY